MIEPDATQKAEIRPRAEALLEGQNRALELIAEDAPLLDVLDYLVRFIESQAIDLYCSVLVLEGDRLRLGAAPSLPEGYNRAVDGLLIGPGVGSCGTAAFSGRAVVVTDIASDPLWADYRDLALMHGLRACWSTPILSRKAEVLGAFAMYHPVARGPSEAELALVRIATHLAGIAIERHHSDEALRARGDALVKADEAKDEFLAMLGHELRNPLAPILTALELLCRHVGDKADLLRYCKVIDRQARLLVRLVDDLLDVSRITRGTISLDKKHASVAAIVERAIEATESLIERRQHELRVELPNESLDLDGDLLRLGQVFSNLLNNAAKYTPPGGHIHVSAARDKGDAVIRVRDDGIGITPETSSRVFDLFFQADRSVDRPQGGLGIGLTLVRKIVEMHGGSVSVSSAGLGKGSEFTVRLPLLAGDSGRIVDPEPKPETRGGGRRVLVVDDNVDAADCMALALEELGYQVMTARDGEAALEYVRSFAPDCVLLDIGLPGLDGYEVTRRLRSEHGAHTPRIIALTGYGLEVDRRAPPGCDFDARLLKPAHIDRVVAALGSGASPLTGC